MQRRILLLAIMTAALTQACAELNWRNWGVAPAAQPVVTAQKFVLIDAQGKAVAELGAAQGGSGLVLMDSAGQPRAALVLTSSGEPGLKLYDDKGVVRAALVVATDGRTGLVLYDGHDKNRAALATGRDGAPAMVLFDRDGRAVKLIAAPAGERRRERAVSGQ